VRANSHTARYARGSDRAVLVVSSLYEANSICFSNNGCREINYRPIATPANAPLRIAVNKHPHLTRQSTCFG